MTKTNAERLREDAASLRRSGLDSIPDRMTVAAAEIERLRAELDQRNAEFKEYARETELEFRKLRGTSEPEKQA